MRYFTVLMDYYYKKQIDEDEWSKEITHNLGGVDNFVYKSKKEAIGSLIESQFKEYLKGYYVFDDYTMRIEARIVEVVVYSEEKHGIKDEIKSFGFWD